jgi:hypothetical protein
VRQEMSIIKNDQCIFIFVSKTKVQVLTLESMENNKWVKQQKKCKDEMIIRWFMKRQMEFVDLEYMRFAISFFLVNFILYDDGKILLFLVIYACMHVRLDLLYFFSSLLINDYSFYLTRLKKKEIYCMLWLTLWQTKIEISKWACVSNLFNYLIIKKRRKNFWYFLNTNQV